MNRRLKNHWPGEKKIWLLGEEEWGSLNTAGPRYHRQCKHCLRVSRILARQTRLFSDWPFEGNVLGRKPPVPGIKTRAHEYLGKKKVFIITGPYLYWHRGAPIQRSCAETFRSTNIPTTLSFQISSKAVEFVEQNVAGESAAFVNAYSVRNYGFHLDPETKPLHFWVHKIRELIDSPTPASCYKGSFCLGVGGRKGDQQISL